jgi:hypothetical protein
LHGPHHVAVSFKTVWFGVSARCFKNPARSAETCFTLVTLFKEDMVG